ncbi:helix-turn-helix domain-containing protein [Burkholderia pseudomallei]|uniref:helix-turn-helix domain-containing protein n=1 Tax=Burkholderia pseudomallei TaxID=28450 RepID=UPI0021F7650A|nr:helix-turn-helix domain-containing protein [Burkholderia pseudomallei]MCW0163802.1 helix-turn-helix domain-containing protein [Burkholderia pseudomallei]
MTIGPIASTTQPTSEGTMATRDDALHGLLVRSEAAMFLGCSLYAVDRLCRRYDVHRIRSPRGYLYVDRAGLQNIKDQLDTIRGGSLLDERGAAERLGLSRAAVRTLVKRDVLKPAAQVRRTRYFHPEDLDDLDDRMHRDGYISAARAPGHLGVTRQRLSQLVREGRLNPYINPRGRRLFEVAELDAYRREHPKHAPDTSPTFDVKPCPGTSSSAVETCHQRRCTRA